MKNCLIIGGGIMGLCSAYYLHKEGCNVTVIDQSNMDAGASYVNAGYLSPSHIIPLAAPGVMKKGLKWMFNSSSPLYLKPRLEADFIKWVWAFNKSCTHKKVQKAIPAIRDIALFSQDLYDEIKASENFSFHYEKRGLMMLCQTEKGLETEISVANLSKANNLDAKVLNPDDIKVLDPMANINAIGGVFYECDYHTTPHEFMSEMKAYLKKAGVSFYPNEKVKDLQVTNNRVEAVITEKNTFRPDEVVLAAGSWSHILSKKLGLKLLLQAGKGYRINVARDTGISIPSILSERKIAVTPMNGFTRFAGTMEIAGINHDINSLRVEAIAKGAASYYNDLRITEAEKKDAACGLRPVSPDGLPYIGKSSKCSNLTLAAGHAMMGWSMGTATGKLVSEIITNKKTSLDISLYHPDRKF
jgi:D-amino-acid dehydrogenase